MSGAVTITKEVIGNKTYFFPDITNERFVEGMSVQAAQASSFLMHPKVWEQLVGEFQFIPQGITGDEEAEYVRIGKRFEDATEITLGGTAFREVALETPTTLKDLDQWLTIEKTLRARHKDEDYIYGAAQSAPVDTELAIGVGKNTALATAIKTYYKETQPITPASFSSGGIIP